MIHEHGLTFDGVSAMDAGAVDDLFFPKSEREPNGAYLRQDMAPLVERKKRNRKLPVKLFWIEYCERAESEGKLAYSYQMFARLFADEAEKMGATRHFTHEAGAKCYIDWAGDVAHLTDRPTGARTKVYVLVVALPFSGKFWVFLTSPARAKGDADVFPSQNLCCKPQGSPILHGAHPSQ